jgi:hypothetical protein
MQEWQKNKQCLTLTSIVEGWKVVENCPRRQTSVSFNFGVNFPKTYTRMPTSVEFIEYETGAAHEQDTHTSRQYELPVSTKEQRRHKTGGCLLRMRLFWIVESSDSSYGRPRGDIIFSSSHLPPEKNVPNTLTVDSKHAQRDPLCLKTITTKLLQSLNNMRSPWQFLHMDYAREQYKRNR